MDAILDVITGEGESALVYVMTLHLEFNNCFKKVKELINKIQNTSEMIDNLIQNVIDEMMTCLNKTSHVWKFEILIKIWNSFLVLFTIMCVQNLKELVIWIKNNQEDNLKFSNIDFKKQHYIINV